MSALRGSETIPAKDRAFVRMHRHEDLDPPLHGILLGSVVMSRIIDIGILADDVRRVSIENIILQGSSYLAAPVPAAVFIRESKSSVMLLPPMDSRHELDISVIVRNLADAPVPVGVVMSLREYDARGARWDDFSAAVSAVSDPDPGWWRIPTS